MRRYSIVSKSKATPSANSPASSRYALALSAMRSPPLLVANPVNPASPATCATCARRRSPKCCASSAISSATALWASWSCWVCAGFGVDGRQIVGAGAVRAGRRSAEVRRAAEEVFARPLPRLAREIRGRHHREAHLVPSALPPPLRRRHRHHRCHARAPARARFPPAPPST